MHLGDEKIQKFQTAFPKEYFDTSVAQSYVWRYMEVNVQAHLTCFSFLVPRLEEM